MERNSLRELQARVVCIRIACIELALRIASVSGPCRADIEHLRLVGAIAMAFEADFIFVNGPWDQRVAGGLPFYSCQRSAHQRWLRRHGIGGVAVMAAGAFSVAGLPHAGFRQRV